MHHFLRKVTALGFLGCVTMGIALHGCTSRLGPVRATQSAGWVGHPNLQDIVLEKSSECVAVYAQQMAPGRVVIPSTVKVDEGGDKLGVTIDGIPNTAPDFGACLRNVLRYMPIAEQPLHEGVDTLKFHIEHANDSQEALKRFIEVIPGVSIVESEMVLEVEGYTVVVPVTVKVVENPEKLSDLDNVTLERIGQLAMATLGYEEIMRRAEMMGWVKRVPIKLAQSVAGKMVIANEATAAHEFKRIFTKWAVAAAVTSQVDSPAPGLADAVALGLLVGGLCHASGVAIQELIDNPTATVAPTATATPSATASTTTATPTTTTSVPAVVKSRKYPNQTCEDDERERLGKEMDKICKPEEGFATVCPKDPLRKKEFAKIPCSLIKLSLQQRRACMAARWVVQDKCFGGKPDPEHEGAIDQVQNGIDNCEAFKLINCAKDHPMAGK